MADDTCGLLFHYLIYNASIVMYITLVDIFDTLHTSSSQEALNEKIN